MASAAAAQEWRYDVFLSFRGADTRKNFTSHLYKDLTGKGVVTFKDDRELPKGESVPQQLPKAIQDSGILVVIFSQNYANSTWCLDELVKIFECKKAGRQTVLPIFYDVSPHDVRKQDGKFGEPFTEYEKLFKNNFQKVQEWRGALTEVANLSGWHLGDRDESEFIQDIVEAILRRFRRSSHSIAKDFVGMESRLEKMYDSLDLEQLNKVRIIGICGMGGIGKTTIAGVVYKDIRWQFEGSCFLGSVRESFEKNGIVFLQKQLLSATLMYDGIPVYDVYGGTDEIRNRFCRKRILVILDDVDHLEQLESLIGRRDENWFGIGSRVIITTRDEHLLKQYGVDETYCVEGLNYEDAFELFCSKAIKNNSQEEEYRELCHEFVEYASGLPLALKVLGSSLFGQSVKEWNKTLDKLKKIPNEEILSKLQLSYDGLDRTSQEIFLDIACFFKGMETDYVLKVLESCGFFPDSGVGDLIDKSLITIYYGRVWMHDLIQEMGREIVHKESRENPGLRRRIWLDKDVSHIQVKNMEANVKAIVLHSWKQEEQLNAKLFSRMKELRLLILRDVPASQDIEYLSNELRYLEWYKCPCKSFPSNFQPGKLVELHMKCSNIEQLWKRSIKPVNELLKVIDLSYSRSLIKTPDFQGLPNLEELNLEGCESLREVHQSIGVMKRLVFLNLKNCRNLVALPSSMCNLKSLQTLILSGCSKLIKLPDRWEDMTCLEKLDATGIGMEQLELAEQWDFHLPPWLMSWTWKNPHPMAIVFSSGLPALKELNASYCKLPERAIPNDLSVSFPFLERLDLSGNNFVSLPSSISNLSHLDSLEVSNCKRLQLLPDLPSTITSLHANNCTSLENLPNVSEKQNNPVNILMEFSNCSKLNDNYQGNIKAAFTWLKSHLLFLLASRLVLSMRHERCCPEKGYYLGEPHSLMFLDISMRFPGSEIPEWFNCQSSSNPLTLLLPPCEKWWNIAGFVICVVISGKAVYDCVEGLNYEDAFELFCSKAIKNNSQEEEYRELCHEFVEYASGLPLALKVLGSSLFGQSVKEWNKTLDKLKKIPNEEILSKLQLSYDGLDRTSQEIFLDIACFFKGMETDYVLKVLESCGFFPDSGVGDLIDKSLITICCGSVWMHDLIQEMGREIVHKESRENPGLRSRIWLDKDVSHIQVKNMEANAKAIVLRSWKQEEQLSAKVFSRMKVLRLLILRDVPASQDIEYLSNELRYLEWYKYPCKSFPSNFQPGKLVELHMKCSNIEQLWKRSIKPVNELLKIIDLSYSRSLIKTPDFQGLPNLEKLNLEGCESLREVHQSIGVMKRLVFLNLKNCRNLVALPSSMCNLKSLQTLILSGCSKLIKLPDRWEDMTCLEKLDATGIGMEQLELAEQWDFHLPPWLMSWTWKNPHPMAIVFSSGLPALKELNASYCNLPEGAIPNDLSVSFPFLERLDLSGNNFKGYYLGEPHSLMFLDISMRFPGSEIPEWFNCQSSSNPLTILLPPCEKWWNIAGFVICVVISGKAVYDGERPCKFILYEENKEVWNNYLSLKFPSNDVPLTSDHLYIFSVANPIPIKYPSYVRFESGHCYSSPDASPIPRDPHEEQGVTKVELTFDENVIKSCGIRIVRANELNELIQKRKPSKEDTELGLKSKRERKISWYLELIDSSSANPIPIDPCEEQSVTEDTEFGFRELRRSYLELIDTVIWKTTRSWERKLTSYSSDSGKYVFTEIVGYNRELGIRELNQLIDTSTLTLSYSRLHFTGLKSIFSDMGITESRDTDDIDDSIVTSITRPWYQKLIDTVIWKKGRQRRDVRIWYE
ncbi:hypothetical protein JCGZ_18062 [Jatropha curcas]|uniref:ADP-ribosyl cyclase/cyclic ADP-ribose hydrolase n=1 Tax=Jatropha curcas TaxID=180498 RepID=A0A067K510_JATCU|nr:hypothetical protein JCGZ_18062 [Jatropha curcas]